LTQLVLGLTLGSVYSLIAIGFSLTYRSIGLLNFAHPEFMMVGAMIGFSLTRLGLPFPLAIPVAALGGGLIAVAVDLLSIRWITRRRAAEANRIIATIGWGSVLTNAALLLWGPAPLAYPADSGSVLSRPIDLAGATVTVQNLVIFATGVALMLAFHLLLRRSRLGYAIRATADDPEAAAMSGIRLERVEVWTFALSGVLGGIAGVFVGALFFASFNLGSFGLRAFAPAVLGGFGDVVGAMVGGLAFGLIETFSTTYLGNGYQDVLAYGIVILILVLRPNGLFGSRRRAA
jgi:branched-chain amino acid transport system permease protein